MLLGKSIILAALAAIVTAALLASPSRAAERVAGCANPAVTSVAVHPIAGPDEDGTRIAHVVATATNLGGLGFAAHEAAHLQLYARLGNTTHLLALTAFDVLASGDKVAVERVVALSADDEPAFEAVLVYGSSQFDAARSFASRDCDARDNDGQVAARL